MLNILCAYIDGAITKEEVIALVTQKLNKLPSKGASRLMVARELYIGLLHTSIDIIEKRIKFLEENFDVDRLDRWFY